VTIVYVTKTPVPVAPVPYPSAPAHNNGTSPYPVKPTGSGAVVPPTKPTGTGAPTKPTTYTPPAQFTGAASQVGASLLAVVAAGFLVL
jgi:chitinase